MAQHGQKVSLQVNPDAETALYSVWHMVSTGLRRASTTTGSGNPPGAGRTISASLGIKEQPLASNEQLDHFLRSVERQAYVTARTMTGDAEEAFDVVQDAMMRFARRYARRPEKEWRPLFFRILVNRCRDFHRRRGVRARVMSWRRADDGRDPVDSAPAPRYQDPAVEAAGEQSLAALERAMEKLPGRQKEAFVLRCLEGLDVAGTAQAMGCSEGSVKTHYSRALAALRAALGEHWDG